MVVLTFTRTSLKEICHEYDVQYGGMVSAQKRVEQKLRRNPELIIIFLNEYPETKKRVFERIKRCGGVKFYRYLDMDNAVIQYIKANLEDMQE